jgi:MtaA/CmuA family methyltransferase
MSKMNSLQRSLCAIRHERPDRVPVIPQSHIWVEYYYGSSSDELMWNGAKYAELQIAGWREFGWDGVFVATDSVALAQSLGLEVLYTDLGAAPGPIGLLDSLEDVNKLELIDPRKTRLNEWIVATQRLMDEIGDEVLVIARADAGPFSLAAQLRGMEAFLLDVGEGREPQLLDQLLSFCTEYALSFATLLLATGAHVVTIGDALASGSLISPKTFERYAFPYQKRLTDAIHARGGRFSIHVCGRTTRVMPRLVATGADILEFDALTDFDTAWEAARGRSCLLGNVPVSEVITLGTPAQIREECRWRLEKVKPAHGGYILSSGCALSSNVPVANVHAMVEAAEEFGYY